MRLRESLPKGVWLECNRPNGRRDRYRVRLYKNHIIYHAGYYYDLESALEALTSLKRRLAELPTERRSNKATEINIPVSTIVGMTLAMEQKRQINPRAARVRRE